MNNKHLKETGFTLIELMIVIAIVGILAAIALPAYQDYVVRSKLSEPLAKMAEAKTTVSEYVAANRGYPEYSSSFGADLIIAGSSTHNSVATFGVLPDEPQNNGTIYILAGVFSDIFDGGTRDLDEMRIFALSGSTNADGSMSWECVSTSPYNAGRPGVELKYLPASCRG